MTTIGGGFNNSYYGGITSTPRNQQQGDSTLRASAEQLDSLTLQFMNSNDPGERAVLAQKYQLLKEPWIAENKVISQHTDYMIKGLETTYNSHG